MVQGPRVYGSTAPQALQEETMRSTSRVHESGPRDKRKNLAQRYVTLAFMIFVDVSPRQKKNLTVQKDPKQLFF